MYVVHSRDWANKTRRIGELFASALLLLLGQEKYVHIANECDARDNGLGNLVYNARAWRAHFIANGKWSGGGESHDVRSILCVASICHAQYYGRMPYRRAVY